jgi:hypothetical protein
LPCALVGVAVVLAAREARVQLVEPRASDVLPTVPLLAASDSALARRAGWSLGLPGNTMRIRKDQDLNILSYTTDDQGALTLPDPAVTYGGEPAVKGCSRILRAPLLVPSVTPAPRCT